MNASASDSEEQRLFESAVNALRTEIANVGTHLAIDGTTRAIYDRQILAMATDLRRKAQQGQITWAQAAAEANTVRNRVMETLRSRSTPVGRALAQSIKSQGRTLNELVARKTLKRFGSDANFNTLSKTQQNQV